MNRPRSSFVASFQIRWFLGFFLKGEISKLASLVQATHILDGADYCWWMVPQLKLASGNHLVTLEPQSAWRRNGCSSPKLEIHTQQSDVVLGELERVEIVLEFVNSWSAYVGIADNGEGRDWDMLHIGRMLDPFSKWHWGGALAPSDCFQTVVQSFVKILISPSQRLFRLYDERRFGDHVKRVGEKQG